MNIKFDAYCGDDRHDASRDLASLQDNIEFLIKKGSKDAYLMQSLHICKAKLYIAILMLHDPTAAILYLKQEAAQLLEIAEPKIKAEEEEEEARWDEKIKEIEKEEEEKWKGQ